MDEILRIQGLTKRFTKRSVLGRGSSTVNASDGVSFSVRDGEVFVIAGESGSGKSTIAKMILGSVERDAGRIFFRGEEVGQDAGSLKRIRMQCQMIHQDPYDSIDPRMRVGDIVAEPLQIHSFGTAEQVSERVAEVLGEVRLEPVREVVQKYPHMLSGGQRQRVVLARALAIKPNLIIADEPVSMLDVSIRAEMLELMGSLQAKHGITFVYITHDLATACFLGTRIAILYMGKVVEIGPINEVLLDPRHPYTQALIDALPEPDPANRFRKMAVRINEVPAKVGGGCRFRARCPYAIDRCAQEPDLSDIATAGGGGEGNGRAVACFVDITRPC